MGRKVLVSFLGTSEYIPCNYIFKNLTIENVKYIQEALAQIECSSFTEQDKMTVFLTKEAKEKNWLGNGKLYDQLYKLSLKCSILPIDIEDGNSEESIWNIFETVYNSFDENDEVYFDITHGFRSLPMLIMALLNYAKTLKKITVKAIYYGAVEAIQKKKAQRFSDLDIKDRNAPVFDLSAFNILLEWNIGVDDFIRNGKSERIAQLIQNEVVPFIKNESKKEQAINEKSLATLLQKISMQILTVRGTEINEGIEFKNAKNCIQKIKETGLIVKPLMPLLEKIEEKIAEFNENDIHNGFIAVKWCIEHQMYQQGIALLQENVINYILYHNDMDTKKRELREIVSILISEKNSRNKNNNFRKEYKNYSNEIQQLENDDILVSCSKPYQRLRSPRNNLMHAGYSESNYTADKFKAVLQQCYLEIETVLGKEKTL